MKVNENNIGRVAYFIASYGKPEYIPTFDFLMHHITGNYLVYIVIGKDDPKFEEYEQKYYDRLLVFDKADYIPYVDDLGVYAKTHKVCTYSRLAVHEFAKQLGIRYPVYMFDDIESMQLRYRKSNGKIASTKDFCVDNMIDLYIDLLNSSKDIYIVGPPNSSFYIGVNEKQIYNYSTRFGNMFVYDIEKELEPFKSSVLEDMSIILYNNQVGKMSICPFGMQVNCRPPKVTGDSYGNMTKLEYNEHHGIISQSVIDLERPTIPYVRFTPKIIEKGKKVHGKKRLI